MARHIYIAGVDRFANDYEKGTLSIQQALTYQIDTADFHVRGVQPTEGDEVIISDDSLGRLFAGIITKVDLAYTTPDRSTNVWSVQCDDYTALLDRRLVVETYANMTADAIFRDIVTKYCPGFIANGVKAGAPTIEAISFDYTPVSESFKQLCDYVGWQWQPDYFKDLSFYNAENVASPAPITLKPGGYFRNLKHTIDQQGLRNRVYVRGGTMLSDPWTYSIKADGAARQWVLPHKPHQISMTVNGTAVRVGIENVHDEAQFDYMMNYEEKYVRASNQTATIASGTTISWTYKYDLDVITMVEDIQSQQAIAKVQGGDGVYEYAITDDSLTTIDAAEAAGNADLRLHANPIVKGSFETEISGWAPGQLVTIDLPDRGINGTFLVQKVTITPATDTLWTYKVEYGGRLLGIADFLKAMLSAQQKKKLNDTALLHKFAYGAETAKLTDEVVTTSRATGWKVEQSVEIDSLKPGSALAFNGADSSVVIPNSSVFNMTNTLTIEATVIPRKGRTAPTGHVLSKELDYKFRVSPDGHIDFLSTTNNAWAVKGTSVGTIPDDARSNIAVTYDASIGKLRFYINGVFDSEFADSGEIVNSNSYLLCIGVRDNGTPTYPFDGIISEVRLWNVVRPVASLHVPLTGNESGLVGYWKLNDGNGTVAKDLTINQNHGTISKCKWVQEFATVGSNVNVSDPNGMEYQTSVDGGVTWSAWQSVNPAQRDPITVPHPCRLRLKANGRVQARNWKKPFDETDVVCGFVEVSA
ncbi:LamG domain-containing protein [Effusibacillus dendaii]|uniref:Uncharacterized protein n=1 Tax=Effusibacillus dendaii TaxID=2743772 RepID=A0A7I8DC84_9BACL|nr:LamG domain-containing protein [Effusibacillus dendaii]BCJ86446.1 hypothetical protein skT53_14310 [Effusibacillus dendaii]